MNNPEKFINWLEGFLDACKNTPSASQVKEIRKKLTETKTSQNTTIPLYDSLTSNHTAYPINPVRHAEFLQAIEDHKNASTLEELN